MRIKIEYGPCEAVFVAIGRDGNIHYGRVGYQDVDLPENVTYEARYISCSGLTGSGVLSSTDRVLMPFGTIRTDTSHAREQSWTPSPWAGWEWAALQENQQRGCWKGLIAIRHVEDGADRIYMGICPMDLSEGPAGMDWSEAGGKARMLEWLPDGAPNGTYSDLVSLITSGDPCGVSAWDLIPSRRWKSEALGDIEHIRAAALGLCGFRGSWGVPCGHRVSAIIDPAEGLDRDLPNWRWDAERKLHWRPVQVGWQTVDRGGSRKLFALANWPPPTPVGEAGIVDQAEGPKLP